MIQILTVTSIINDGAGDPLNGVLKVRASQAFTYVDGTSSIKVGTDYTVVSVVEGQLYSTLSLAPTSGAEHNKTNLFYVAELWVNNVKISSDYWLLAESIGTSVEYTDIPVANPANKQPYVPAPYGASDGSSDVDLSAYATKVWVESQGYITDLSDYATIDYVDGLYDSNYALIQQNITDIEDNLGLIADNTESIETNELNISLNSVEIAANESLSNLNASTGLLIGGAITTNEDYTFNIALGSGYIVDATTDPSSPTQTSISWDAFEDVTLTYLSTAVSTYIGIDSTGSIVQQVTDFTSAQRKTIIRLGRIAHFDKATINTSLALGILRYNKDLNGEDLALSLGTINSAGNVYSAASTNLTLAKSAGECYRLGINSQLDNTSPNQTTNAAIPSVTFSYVYSDGSGGAIFVNDQTNVDPDQYDNGDGTLGSVANNDYTIQRIYYYPVSNVTVVAYGQEIYTNLGAAQAGFLNDPTPDFEVLDGSVLRGAMIIQEGVTDLSTGNVTFVTAGKLGEFVGSGGSGSTDLQTAYNNSLDNTIITTSGALILQNGSTDNTEAVLTISNYAGTETTHLYADGAADFSGNVTASESTSDTHLITQGQVVSLIDLLDDIYLPLTAGSEKALIGTLYGTDIDMSDNLYLNDNDIYAVTNINPDGESCSFGGEIYLTDNTALGASNEYYRNILWKDSAGSTVGFFGFASGLNTSLYINNSLGEDIIIGNDTVFGGKISVDTIVGKSSINDICFGTTAGIISINATNGVSGARFKVADATTGTTLYRWLDSTDDAKMTLSPEGNLSADGTGAFGSTVSHSSAGGVSTNSALLSDVTSLIDTKEDAFTKNTAFNKDFGETGLTVAYGNHNHGTEYIYSTNGSLFTPFTNAWDYQASGSVNTAVPVNTFSGNITLGTSPGSASGKVIKCYTENTSSFYFVNGLSVTILYSIGGSSSGTIAVGGTLTLNGSFELFSNGSDWFLTA